MYESQQQDLIIIGLSGHLLFYSSDGFLSVWTKCNKFLYMVCDFKSSPKHNSQARNNCSKNTHDISRMGKICIFSFRQWAWHMKLQSPEIRKVSLLQ